MTPDPKALAVLLDAMCAAYGYSREEAEEAEKYARNREAVHTLVRGSITSATNDGSQVCASCGYDVDEFGISLNHSHERACWVAAAWRALGDPRGAADIERAHEEALRQHTTWSAIADRERDAAHVAGQVRELSPEMQRMLTEARRRSGQPIMSGVRPLTSLRAYNYVPVGKSVPSGQALRDVVAGEYFEVGQGQLSVTVVAAETIRAGNMVTLLPMG